MQGFVNSAWDHFSTANTVASVIGSVALTTATTVFQLMLRKLLLLSGLYQVSQFGFFHVQTVPQHVKPCSIAHNPE